MSPRPASPAGDFGRRIYLARTMLGLTQAEAAAHVGVAPNTWARWERGEMNPPAYARPGILATLAGTRRSV